MNPHVFDLIRLFVASVMLIYSSVLDVIQREVPNKVWAVFGPIAIAILIAQLVLSPLSGPKLWLMMIDMVLMIGFSIGGFYFGLYGGADAKAFMVLAVLQPTWPYYTINPLPQVPFLLDTLINGALISLINLAVFLLINATRGNLDFPYCLFGVKRKLENVKGKFFWPMYRLKEGRLVRSLKPPMEEEEEKKIWEEIERRGLREIWVTPQLPFLVYVTIGYYITAIYGDLILKFFIGLLPA